MLKHALVLFFALVLGSGPVLAGQPLRIMPLGDSITEGGYNLNNVYYSEGGGYRLWLEVEILPVNPDLLFVGSLAHGPLWMPQRHHEGHSGWRIEQISANVVPWLQTYKPDIILLMIGTNNMWQDETRIDAPEMFDQLLNKIWSTLPNTEVFAASIINTNNKKTNADIAAYNAAISKIVQIKKMEGHPTVWVDMNHESGITAQDLTDGVHPTSEGYRKIAGVWRQYLLPVITK